VELVTVGIGAITVASLLLGWALLAISEVSRRAAANARRSGPGPLQARAGFPSNTLRAVEGPAPRRRRDPVSGQFAGVARRAGATAAGAARGAVNR
jgi:hypothetical protein